MSVLTDHALVIPPIVRTSEDVQLARRAAVGDARAQSVLAVRLSKRVHRVMRGLSSNHQDAEDATQEALIEILGAVAHYRADGPIEHWAERIAVRVGLRLRHRERRAPSTTAIGPDELLAPTPVSSSRELLPRALSDYLDALPEDEREVLFLKHGLGYSLPEVATEIGVARSTTKYRLAKALARIRRAIRRDIFLSTSRLRPHCMEEGDDGVGAPQLAPARGGRRRLRRHCSPGGSQ